MTNSPTILLLAQRYSLDVLVIMRYFNYVCSVYYHMKYLAIIIGLISITSCQNNQDKQALEQLDKKSAREVTLKTVTRGDSVLHITTQHIWFNGEQITSASDTIITPISPGTWGVTDSLTTLSKVPIYVTVQ